jgi:TIR domain
MKKVFFAYSDDTEDIDLYKELKQHFTAYARQGFLAIMDRDELFRRSGNPEKYEEFLRESDFAVPLLSIDYLNSEECLKLLDMAKTSDKPIIPILLRACEWEEIDKLRDLEKNILPDNKQSVSQLISSAKSGDVIFSGIARQVKAVVFSNDLKKLQQVNLAGNTKTFYYILAGIVLLIGVLAAAISYSKWTDWKISTVIFLMFVVIALLAVKNVLFPTKFRIS